MATGALDDEVLADVIASNRLAKSREVEDGRTWGQRYHPDKDLAEVLMLRGVLDRGQVALARRLAKMARSGSARRPAPTAPEPAAAPPIPTEVAAADTQALPQRALASDPPERIGRYEVLEKVAQGGMGVIYKARHPDLDRVFAIKLLTPRTQQSEEALARFQREAKTAARLDHPNIVRVYDAGTADGLPFIVMDFVDGPDLATLIKEEGIGLRKAAQVARSLALALHHAHENGVVHRDVKPENVILDRTTGEPKITDFGIVKELAGEEEDERRLTQTGFTLGSPCYMSPEQAQGRHDLVGPQTDVYSLAATLYEMLTGEPPFDGGSVHEIMTSVVRDEAVRVRVRNAAVPADLEVVCMKGLEKEMDRRYATARAFAEDLDRFLADEPVVAKAAGVWTRTSRIVRRNRAASAISALFLVSALVGLGAVANWQHQLAQERRARIAARLERAEAHLAAATAAEEPSERLRGYWKALEELNLLLRERPDHPVALQRKQEAVLAFGDHLIESGETSFAEFVLTILGPDVADEAEITSRLEVARSGAWVQQAEAAELDGDLGRALDLYRRGLRSLREAGYDGDRLGRRVTTLEQALRRQRQRERVDDLLELAAAAAAKGDHATAYRTASEAAQLVPGDAAVAGQVELHRQRATEDVLAARTDAENARSRIGNEPAGEHQVTWRSLVAQGEEALARASEATEQADFGAADRALEEAARLFRVASSLAAAAQALALADAARADAGERDAIRFARDELERAETQRERGKEAIRRGAYEQARVDLERAAAAFRQAAGTASGRGVVAEARSRAQGLRLELLQEVGQNYRTPLFLTALEDFDRAEAHYDDREFRPARDLYEKCGDAFARVKARLPEVRSAIDAQARVHRLRAEAAQQLADRFAPQDYSLGRQAEILGDRLLAEDDATSALEAYRDADYRYRRATKKAGPQAESKRECDALREQVLQARQAWVAEGLEWKPEFKEGDDALREAEEHEAQGYWNGVRRRLRAALRAFRDLPELR